MKAVQEASERRLIEAAQQDPSRFGALYEIHFERVYAYVSRRLQNREAAEDVTSEVFHRGLADLPRSMTWRSIWRLADADCPNAIADRWRRGSREQTDALANDPASAEPARKKSRFARSYSAWCRNCRRAAEGRADAFR